MSPTSYQTAPPRVVSAILPSATGRATGGQPATPNRAAAAAMGRSSVQIDRTADQRRGEQMGIHPADAGTGQVAPGHQREHLLVLRHRYRTAARRRWAQRLLSPPQAAQRQLPDHEGMRPPPHPASSRRRQTGVASRQVIDPNRGVDQHQPTGRRRRGACSPGCVPPRAASRRALSRAISASRPACTSAVFSSIPVRRRARPPGRRSRFSVVRMHMSMPAVYACCQDPWRQPGSDSHGLGLIHRPPPAPRGLGATSP